MGKSTQNAEFAIYSATRIPGSYDDQLYVSKKARRLLRPFEILSADLHFHNRRWEGTEIETNAVSSVPTALQACSLLEATYRSSRGRTFRLKLSEDRKSLYVSMSE